MADPKVYLVTGASRGIGLTLVSSLVGKGETVIATVRDPDNASQLKDLASQNASRLHIVKLDVNQPSTFASTTDQIKKAGFHHLDVSWVGFCTWVVWGWFLRTLAVLLDFPLCPGAIDTCVAGTSGSHAILTCRARA